MAKESVKGWTPEDEEAYQLELRQQKAVRPVGVRATIAGLVEEPGQALEITKVVLEERIERLNGRQ